VPHFPLQSERCGVRLVLLSTIPFSPQFRGGNQSISQYASRWEAKKNSHHLLSVKMRQSDSLKSYISFFQSQLTKVSNCDEDVPALAFICGLQISHSLYKHLLKHNVTRMSKVLSRAQPYIQLEETMKTSFNHTAKHGDGRGKSNSPHEASAHAQDRNQGQPAFKRQVLSILSPNPLRTYKPMEQHLTPLTPHQSGLQHHQGSAVS